MRERVKRRRKWEEEIKEEKVIKRVNKGAGKGTERGKWEKREKGLREKKEELEA